LKNKLLTIVFLGILTYSCDSDVEATSEEVATEQSVFLNNGTEIAALSSMKGEVWNELLDIEGVERKIEDIDEINDLENVSLLYVDIDDYSNISYTFNELVKWSRTNNKSVLFESGTNNDGAMQNFYVEKVTGGLVENTATGLFVKHSDDVTDVIVINEDFSLGAKDIARIAFSDLYHAKNSIENKHSHEHSHEHPQESSGEASILADGADELNPNSSAKFSCSGLGGTTYTGYSYEDALALGIEKSIEVYNTGGDYYADDHSWSDLESHVDG